MLHFDCLFNLYLPKRRKKSRSERAGFCRATTLFLYLKNIFSLSEKLSPVS